MQAQPPDTAIVDVNLCQTLREHGYRVFADMGIRAEHRFEEAAG